MPHRVPLIAAAGLAAIAVPASADILNVPAQYSTIQAAISAAGSGDERTDNDTTVFIMAGWLFGLRRRLTSGLLRRMDALCDTAQIALYRRVVCSFLTELEQEEAIMRAVAIANHCFGHTFHPMHAAVTTPEEVRAGAIKILENDAAIREVVVQALRVKNTIAFGRTGAAPTPPVGADLLARFGHEFPDAPNPEEFASLVHQQIAALPEHIRDRYYPGFAGS